MSATTMDASTTSNTSSPSLPEMRAEATTLLTSGTEHLEQGDYVDAASDLGAASEIFAKVFGETSDECGEAYLLYGKALLYVSIMESEVLGYALDGMELEDDAKTIPQVESPNKLEEKEKSEVTGEVTKALNEHFEAFNRLSKQHFAEGSDEESDSEDVEMEVDSPSKGEKPDADSITAEDTSNLQLAWEMLELAKMIYERKVKDVSVEKKKEVLTALWDATSGLGEVAMEAGNFTQALAEFSSCLDARTSVLPKDSRSIAEAHFQKSRAQAALGQMTESEVSIKAAIAVLEEHALNLANWAIGFTSVLPNSLSSPLTEEIAELEELAVELAEMLVEFKEGLSDQTKRKLSAGSPSAKLAGVDKAPKIDEAKPISSTSVGTA